MFNNTFNSFVKELNIPINQNLLNDPSIFDNRIEKHTSILKTKENVKKHDVVFYHVNPDKMLKILQILTLKWLLSKVISQSET